MTIIPEVRRIFGTWHYVQTQYADDDVNRVNGQVISISRRVLAPIRYDLIKDSNNNNHNDDNNATTKDDNNTTNNNDNSNNETYNENNKNDDNVTPNSNNDNKENDNIEEGDNMEANEELISRRILDTLADKEAKARHEKELSDTKNAAYGAYGAVGELKDRWSKDISSIKQELDNIKKTKTYVSDGGIAATVKKLEQKDANAATVDCPTCAQKGHKHHMTKNGPYLKCTGAGCDTMYALANTKSDHVCANCGFPINKDDNFKTCPWCQNDKAVERRK